MLIIGVQIFLDGLFECLRASVAASSDLATRDFGKPALDLIDPGGTCGSEV